ncbi:Abc transporter atp-binding protein permease wht-3 [Dirofilaria immitis]|nr:Abc transporter atp-binding protein permease wht-3 [Dirofilaria immitis]
MNSEKRGPPNKKTQRQVLDSILGVIVWKGLTEVDFFSGYIWEGLGMMITNLEELIHWLTTYPAGLKLNAHLNAILSQFFVYHIYLWQTYLSVASVYIGFGFISLSCFFGLSVFLLLYLISFGYLPCIYTASIFTLSITLRSARCANGPLLLSVIQDEGTGKVVSTFYSRERNVVPLRVGGFLKSITSSINKNNVRREVRQRSQATNIEFGDDFYTIEPPTNMNSTGPDGRETIHLLEARISSPTLLIPNAKNTFNPTQSQRENTPLEAPGHY